MYSKIEEKVKEVINLENLTYVAFLLFERDCPSTPNPDQKNTNGDEYSDACQMGDQDKDGITDFKDNCRYAANPDQKDEDNDGFGDVCEILFYSHNRSESKCVLSAVLSMKPYLPDSNAL
jgi:thrombospondin type 3 repeat protein